MDFLKHFYYRVIHCIFYRHYLIELMYVDIILFFLKKMKMIFCLHLHIIKKGFKIELTIVCLVARQYEHKNNMCPAAFGAV